MNSERYQPLAMLVLAVALAGATHGAEQRPAEPKQTVAESARALGQAVKHDAKAVGAAVKDGALQVGAAAKRGAKKVQAAVQGK